MAGENERKVRIKIRLRTGEEFEAEGDKTFITEQREEFLNLINKAEGNFTKRQQGVSHGSSAGASLPIVPARERATLQPPPTSNNVTTAPPTPKMQEYRAPENFVLPRELRGPSPSENTAKEQKFAAGQQDTLTTNASLVWSSVARAEGDIVLLRRKFKLLGPSTAALILVAAAKILLRESSYSALKLARSMKASGFMDEGDRLDRITATEVKQGTLSFEGSKRTRSYTISDEGFARAFILAEKLN